MSTCPRCNSVEQQVKIGFTRSGSQRYLCKSCCHKYTPKKKKSGYPISLRQQAHQLHEQGISNRAIGRILRVNYQTVANWIKVKIPSLDSGVEEWKSES